LNEREPLKEQMAKELSEQLKLRSISSTSLSPTTNLALIIQERLPRVLILDFVLGDVATALDILTELKQPLADGSICVILWTDEQSIQVAVNSMKLGARDFIGIEDNRSMEKILHAIESGLQTQPTQEPMSQKHRSTFNKQVGQSKVYREALAIAESQGRLDAPVTIIYGQTGSGRNTLAEYIHQARIRAGNYIAIDYDIWPGQVDHLVGSNDALRSVPILSHRSTVFIDHIEYDTGELLESLSTMQDKIWNTDDKPCLIVGSSSHAITKAWQRLFQCQQISLPSFTERADDILPLLDAFCDIAETNKSKSKPRIPVSIISEIAKLDWPGNVRQFRAAVTEAISMPEDYATHLATQAQIPAKLGLTAAEKRFFCALISAKERWERFNGIEAFVPSPLIVKAALEQSNGNQRIAAAMLGTGVPQIRRALDPNPLAVSATDHPSGGKPHE
jgi:DNA-binding NtrC family response regulator